MKQKLLIFLLAALLLAGCGQQDLSDQQFNLTAQQESSAVQEPAQQEETPLLTEISLAYHAGDSLNPYKVTTSLNRELVPLLYDSLTKPDRSLQPQNQLAAEVKVEGTLCVVTCRSNALFHDGTRLTGEDVIYSINTARASEAGWAPMLQNIAGAAVNADGAVEIRLLRPDADFAALLSFPIIKTGTADAQYPTGVSKYYVSGAYNEGVYLNANPIYYAQMGNIKTIRLLHVSDADELQFKLRTGEVDFAFTDLSAAEIAGLSAANNAVPLNHLVYVGINGGREPLAMPEFRHALSMAINRDELVATAYTGRARASMYPMHPNFYRLSEIDTAAPRNLTQAEQLLSGIGMNEKDADGWRLYKGAPVVLRLLVNSENSYRNAAATLIADQLAQAGIKTELVSRSFSEYQSDLNSGAYDLYIGETRLMDNMDFSSLLSGGALAWRTAYSEELTLRNNTYRESGGAIRELCDMFTAQSPFIPLLFREGLISVHGNFAALPEATQQDLFYNIVDW